MEIQIQIHQYYTMALNWKRWCSVPLAHYGINLKLFSFLTFMMHSHLFLHNYSTKSNAVLQKYSKIIQDVLLFHKNKTISLDACFGNYDNSKPGVYYLGTLMNIPSWSYVSNIRTVHWQLSYFITSILFFFFLFLLYHQSQVVVAP